MTAVSGLISLLAFVAVFLLVLSLNFLVSDLQQARKGKLIESLTLPRDRDGKRVAEEGLGPENLLRNRLLSRFDLTPLRTLLQSSRAGLTLERFLLLSALCGLAFMLLPLFLFTHPLLILMGLIGGLFLPLAVIKIMRTRREEQLVGQLPEAIDTIVRSLRVGHSVDAATLEVARSFPAPIGVEFRTLHEEMAMGLPFETVLRNLQARFPRLPDVRILCATFIIQRETGGNLTEILSGLSSTIRARFRLKRQVKATTAEGRATALILGLMPLCFAVVTWSIRPEYMKVFLEHPLGQKLFLAVVVMEVAGFLLMRALSKVEV